MYADRISDNNALIQHGYFEDSSTDHLYASRPDRQDRYSMVSTKENTEEGHSKPNAHICAANMLAISTQFLRRKCKHKNTETYMEWVK